MKFSDEIIEFLNDFKFSNGLSVPISKINDELISRKELILRIIKNKRVIHLGCCDHIPLIKDKIKVNSWIHKQITEKSKYCLGIDINKDAINYVRSEFKYKNIIYGDITNNKKITEIEGEKFDIMVMGEILEHIDNPVLFLNKIRDNYKTNISQILITVPNAFSYRNIKNLKKNFEQINSDHRYWFTPYTLAKIAIRAGYQISEFFFVDELQNKTGRKAKILVIPYIQRKLTYYKIRKYPAFRTNLVMIINL